MTTRRRLTGPERTLSVLAVVGVIAALAMPSGEAAVFLPMISAMGIALAFIQELWRRERVLPLDEVGLWFALVVTIYTVWPLLVFQLIGLQYTPFNDNRLFFIQPSPTDVARIGWWHVAFLTAFVISYLLVRKRVPPPFRESPVISRSRLIMAFTVWGATTVVTILVSRQLSTVVSDTYTGGYAAVASLPLVVRQIMRLGSSVAFVVNLVLLVWLFSDYKKRWWIVWIWLAMQIAPIILSPGARTGVALSLLACFILYHLRVRHVRPLYAGLFGFFGIAGFLLLGVMRAIGNLAAGGTALFTLPIGGEFESLFGNAVDLYHRSITGGIPPVPLGVHLADIIAPIPSQLLPFQKFDPSSWYMATFYPEALEQGSGLAFGSIAQSVIGFGLPEVFIRGALLGLIFAAAFRFYRRRQRRLWVVVGYLWITLWSYQCYRASTLALFSPFIQQFLFTVIVFEVGGALLEGASRYRGRSDAVVNAL